ncbi:MAG: 23S rRNA (adenine(2503)-C(2))-methyltransferase RlmN [Syntrophomonadaceae bacterium]|jgi:23S rRNA (adenine2503-C2)-methyltransferase|nr:23S rRNA (adenine(2503)-C(2))-methyltransferase RlmN [Syntrophomonadaceae bacterium]
MSKLELLGMNQEELEDWALDLHEPRFRGRQIYKWIYAKNTNSFYEMSDIPRELRIKLDDIAQISIPRVLKQKVSADGTRKFLMELEDKKRIETVLIPQSKDKNTRYTICISSQVGCPIQCEFCATGQTGFQRNLQAFEIVGQVLGSSRELMRRLKSGDYGLITNIVYMGMGEPMLNYDEVLKSIYILNNPKGVNIGQRRMTISTAGEVSGIEKLAQENLQVNLAVSLHAADDKLRSSLMPINNKYSLPQLVAAVESYIKKTNRKVTFEYLLLGEINMRPVDAENLIRLLKSQLVTVNLIPYNKINEAAFSAPGNAKVRMFYDKLVHGGLNVTVRQEHGSDIDAACGQLAAQKSSRF